jgi:hypothetical protein
MKAGIDATRISNASPCAHDATIAAAAGKSVDAGALNISVEKLVADKKGRHGQSEGHRTTPLTTRLQLDRARR